MALQIVERPAHRHGPAVAEIGGVHEVGPARENVGLQCHAEAAAIVDHLHKVMRDAARAGVEVEPLVEGAGLELVAELAKAVAAPERQAAPAGAPRSFEDDTVVAGLVEFIGRAEPATPAPRIATLLPLPELRGSSREAALAGGGLRKSHKASAS